MGAASSSPSSHGSLWTYVAWLWRWSGRLFLPQLEGSSETHHLRCAAHDDSSRQFSRCEGELAAQVAALQCQVARLSAQVKEVSAKMARHGLRFNVAQYNILAGYLGRNTEPWFLYGVEMPPERREQVVAKHLQRDAQGKFVNVGWPSYVRGILTDAEIEVVEAIDRDRFAWPARRERIVAQIRALDADVISLVECDDYEEYFEEQLRLLGYDSTWCKRPRPSTRDGCCIAWKRHMFTLDKPVGVEEYIDRYDPVNGQFYKDRIALLALLRFIGSEQRLLVVSTHLTRNPEDPKMDALRAKQIGQVLRKITEYAVEHDCVDDAPVVLAGDLNATSFQKLRGIANAVTLMLGAKHVGRLHPFAFDCKELPTGKTSVTTARDVRIDALLYESQRLLLVDSLKAPNLPEAIPNHNHPSDHIPIMATFEMRSQLCYHQQCASSWFNTVAGRTGHVPLTRKGLECAYFCFEVNSDGIISQSEFITCVSQQLGFDMLSDEEVNTTYRKSLDSSGDGITFSSFTSAYCRALTQGGLPGLDDLRDAFVAFDKDGNGTLTPDEVEEVFANCSPIALPEGTDITSIVARFDDNGDGYISIEEFLSGLTVSWVEHAALP
mmetsp:Transcript_9291/g.20710  ORF Transcript_9291/g.20710 Transcript_9291/m.20710 type:complete len:608 (+) Transcript_9291:115-1938(+)